MDLALDYLTSKPRTQREMELYLDDKQFGEFEVYNTVERLKELGLINDDKYAVDFIATRLATKPFSRRALYGQLYAHKLDKELISEALAAVTDDVELENAMTVGKKVARKYEGYGAQEQKQRTARRLLGRGYEYSAVKSTVEKLFGDDDGVDYDGSFDEKDED